MTSNEILEKKLEILDDYNKIWKLAQLENIPKNPKQANSLDWEFKIKPLAETALRYKNFSAIEILIKNYLEKNPFDHKKVLSIGCGAGKDLEGIRKIFPASQLCGIDQSKHALKEAKKHSNADFICALAEYLPFRDDLKFDGFIAGHTLDLAPNADDSERIVGELTKYAAEKSRFYMTFYWHGYIEDGTCPDLELGVCTPVGNALGKFGWVHKQENFDYSLTKKSPYAEGVFWVVERNEV